MPVPKANPTPWENAHFVNPLGHLLQRALAHPHPCGDLAFFKRVKKGLEWLKPQTGHQYAVPQKLGEVPPPDAVDCLP